jgi:hypothetical protein
MIISNTHNFIFFHVPKNAGTSICAKLAPFSENSEIIPTYKNKIKEIVENANTDEGRKMVNEIAHLIPDELFDANVFYKKNKNKLRWMNLPHLCLAIHGVLSFEEVKKIRNSLDSRWNVLKNYHRFAIVRNSWDYAFSIFKNKVVIDRVAEEWKEGKSWNYMIKNRITKENFLHFIRNLETDYSQIYNDFFFNLEFKKELNQLDYITSPKGYCYVNQLIRYEKIKEGLEIASDKIGVNLVDSPKLNVSMHSIREKDPFDYVNYYDDDVQKKISEIFKKDINHFNFKFGK